MAQDLRHHVDIFVVLQCAKNNGQSSRNGKLSRASATTPGKIPRREEEGMGGRESADNAQLKFRM